MISNDTILRIKEAAQIEEVVGEFVSLKKRGSRYVGLCPFHAEKTPSFTVTPSLNIYKCFGCGASGDSIKFLMDHEKLTYTDALRYLAAKYHIEIEEVFSEKKNDTVSDDKESLFAVNSFAQKFYAHYLFENETGKTIGYSYFKERGLSDDTIRKYQLGFAPATDNALLKSAYESGYTFEQLQKAGLAIKKNNRPIDFFRERVVFPIHNMAGKVVAFGGRIVRKSDNGPKYINTPETDIYHKSHVLYGIYQAKSAIRKSDQCILTEGYMDVISLAQAGIENVVASSGTSLTSEQVRLIKRLTRNIILLYDGDPAGIKAALRGIDILLEEDMNVRIVLLPESEDPDSYLQKYGASQLIDFINQNSNDFILFKATTLLQDVNADPVKKSDAVRQIVQSIALIPDALKRSTYIKECSNLLQVDEQILVNETNKYIRNKLAKESGIPKHELNLPETHSEPTAQDILPDRIEYLEKDIIRLLFEFAYQPYNEEGNILEFVIAELEGDNFSFSNTTYQKVYNEYCRAFNEDKQLTPQYFLSHSDVSISKLAMEIYNKPYELSENWTKMHGIDITDKLSLIQKDLQSIIYKLKIEIINRKIREYDQQISKSVADSDIVHLLQKKQEFLNAKKHFARLLGMVIV